MSATATWTKACACKAASGTNRLVTRTRVDPKTHAVLITTTFYPMPSCVQCDTPWVLRHDSARANPQPSPA